MDILASLLLTVSDGRVNPDNAKPGHFPTCLTRLKAYKTREQQTFIWPLTAISPRLLAPSVLPIYQA
jgi:hypothetical protein